MPEVQKDEIKLRRDQQPAGATLGPVFTEGGAS